MGQPDEELPDLLANNRAWAEASTKNDPEFFERLSKVQKPDYLWIGCSDSRVPANQIIGLKPGEVFVHRNVANLLLHTDLNALSVLQYAVEYLKVKHIIVCGHYGCGGVAAAYDDKYLGAIDHWLGAIKDEYHLHRAEIDGLENHDARVDRLCELNVMAQVSRVATTSIVQQAWHRGQPLTIHGWIYTLKDGIIKDLHVPISGPDQIEDAYRLRL
jgi:carbonic anhydrase